MKIPNRIGFLMVTHNFFGFWIPYRCNGFKDMENTENTTILDLTMPTVQPVLMVGYKSEGFKGVSEYVKKFHPKCSYQPLLLFPWYR